VRKVRSENGGSSSGSLVILLRLPYEILANLIGISQGEPFLSKLIRENGWSDERRRSLGSFVRRYPKNNQLAFLLAAQDLTNWSADDLEKVKKVVGQNFDRRSFQSTVTQSVVLYAEVIGGRLKFLEGVNPPNLESLFDCFESELLHSEPTGIGSILARQLYLSIKLARNLNLWDWEFGPLALRAMTDAYLTLAWIMKDPEGSGRERSKIYQLRSRHEKLNIAH
jgi:hypothetical protein